MKMMFRQAVIIPVVLLLFNFIFSPASYANAPVGDSNVVDFSFAGYLKNQPVFKLEFDIPETEEFAITIRDDRGETLYYDRLKAKKFHRYFLLDTEQIYNQVIKVEIRFIKNNTVQVYAINRNETVVQETRVSKL